MKRLWTLLLVLLLLLPAGCARPEDVPAPSPTPAPEEPVEHTPLLIVSAGGVTVEPYCHQLHFSTWGGGESMMAGQCIPLHSAGQLPWDTPTLTYGEDFQVEVQRWTTLGDRHIYTLEWEIPDYREAQSMDEDSLDRLPPGKYVVVYDVYVQGREIPQLDTHESSSWQCAFWLIVPEA